MRHTVDAGTSIICPRYFRGRRNRCETHIEPVTTIGTGGRGQSFSQSTAGATSAVFNGAIIVLRR